MNNSKVWFVTGASKGLGLVLIQKLLTAGYRVAATSRSVAALKAAVGQVDQEQFLPLQVELANEHSVQSAISSTIDTFGTIDVVVNNAGFGQLGTFETLTDKEIRDNFDINVFSIMNVLRHVLPHLRNNGSGQIYNISSIIGFNGGFPGWGCYASSKFAVTGLTEALAAEVKSLGISATVVYPGYFRTNFLNQESLAVTSASMSEYTEAQASLDFHLNGLSGTQQGDPAKAADALIQVASAPNPPLHLFLGDDAFNFAQEKIQSIATDMENNKELTFSTSFEK